MGEDKLRALGSSSFRCPNCGSDSFFADTDGLLFCEYCRRPYVPSERVCPACGAEYESGTRHCPACGVDMVRECPNCGALNPPVAVKCLACGQRLEVLDAIFDRLVKTPAGHLHRIRQGAQDIKSQEEQASRARLAKMWAEEDRRRQELARAREEREQQERVMLIVSLALVALVVIALVVVFLSMGGGTTS